MVLAALSFGTQIALSSEVAPKRNLLLTGATVHPAAGEAARSASVLVVDGRVAFVGDAAEARSKAPAGTPRVDLAGAHVFPGFVDAHAHLLGLGTSRVRLDLVGKQKDAILALVAARAKKAKPGEWILGRGWDQNLWPGKAFPLAKELDAASPKNPVALSRIDGHASWVNGEALRAAGLPPEKPAPNDPDGGKIHRDAEGRPSGTLIDGAVDLVDRAIPAPSEKELESAFTRAFDDCARVGLTGVGDASGYSRREVAVLRGLAAKGRMPLRVYATYGAPDPELPKLLAEGPVLEGNLTVRSVKMYADGALGSRGAALLAPYADEPGNSGLVLTPRGKMDEVAALCLERGFQLWTHAIGDRANREVLDVYEAALAKTAARDARPRIEHAQVIAPEDFARFAKLGVIASIQPTHATSDMPWAGARVGPVRVKGAYAYHSLAAAGARLAGGSDFPVESEDPRLGFYAAVTRQDLSGQPEGGFLPAERLSRNEALALFTRDAAYAEFAETRRGRIAEGFDADFTVLARDVTSDGVAAADLPRVPVVLTVVGGEVTYRARSSRK
ncbi:MAG: amidohydrolase [Acidobacteria bacterium]|nr:amidohydrolase [Acidobacteriota bacterium]